MLGSRARRIANMSVRPVTTSCTVGSTFMVMPAASVVWRTSAIISGRGVGNGEEDFLELVTACRSRDIPDTPHDGHPDERHAVDRCVVVEHGDWNQPGVGMADHFADGRRGGIAAPDDGNPQAVAP